MSGLGLTFLRRGGQAHPTAGSDYILSATKGDPEVFRILMEKGVSSDGVGITREDAAKVTTITAWFSKNETIKNFDELIFFIGLKELKSQAGSGMGVFQNCYALESVAVNDAITNVGEFSFLNDSNLVKCNIPRSATKIGDAAYRNVPAEMVLDCPNLKSLGRRTFQNSGLTEILNMGGVTQLKSNDGSGIGVFEGCTKLSIATLPSAMTDMGNRAFAKCTALHTIISYATTPPVGTNIFASGSSAINIYVPSESVASYKAADGWSAYADTIYAIN